MSRRPTVSRAVAGSPTRLTVGGSGRARIMKKINLDGKVLEAVAAWETALGCMPGDSPPEDRCANPPINPDTVEVLDAP